MKWLKTITYHGDIFYKNATFLKFFSDTIDFKNPQQTHCSDDGEGTKTWFADEPDFH